MNEVPRLVVTALLLTLPWGGDAEESGALGSSSIGTRAKIGGQVIAVADPRTSSLLVSASSLLMPQVAKMIQELRDVPPVRVAVRGPSVHLQWDPVGPLPEEAIPIQGPREVRRREIKHRPLDLPAALRLAVLVGSTRNPVLRSKPSGKPSRTRHLQLS